MVQRIGERGDRLMESIKLKYNQYIQNVYERKSDGKIMIITASTTDVYEESTLSSQSFLGLFSTLFDCNSSNQM